MRQLIGIALLFFILKNAIVSYGAYLENARIIVMQPDGTVLELYATGDEYYNWMHDEKGYTVIINPETKYYSYAILENDELVASSGIVGKVLPENMGLKPRINLPDAKIKAIRKNVYDYMYGNDDKSDSLKNVRNTKTSFQTINNIVIYIRFAEQTEFDKPQQYYSYLFNYDGQGGNSMHNYFSEVSYGNFSINSTFYPTNNGSTIISYQDCHTSDYYKPIEISSDSGYIDSQRGIREKALLKRAINSVKSQIPSTLNIDNNNDGNVDNICFIVRGSHGEWGELLWPHYWNLSGENVYINNKKVAKYNFQIESRIEEQGVGVLCHEMNHTLGAPDLYHLNNCPSEPIGKWCLMSYNQNPPQHMCAYIKYRYNGWIPVIPEITTSGTYLLNPLVDSSNNCYKISIKGSSEYLVLEYRKKEGAFENTIYGSGLVIYRINEQLNGNPSIGGFGGIDDMIYAFRPNGSLLSNGNIAISFLSSQSGRDSFNNDSNPYCFTSNGNYGNIYIKNIKESNGIIEFDVRFCDGVNIVKSNTNNLPSITNASNSIVTQNTVVVKSTDNVIFEAANEVSLNPGFEVNSGGQFEINMNGCGEK